MEQERAGKEKAKEGAKREREKMNIVIMLHTYSQPIKQNKQRNIYQGLYFTHTHAQHNRLNKLNFKFQLSKGIAVNAVECIAISPKDSR